MKNLSVFFKALSILVLIAAIIVLLAITTYLKILPAAVSNELVINFVKDFVKESTGAELVLDKPVLKTELSPQIGFKFEQTKLYDDGRSFIGNSLSASRKDR